MVMWVRIGVWAGCAAGFLVFACGNSSDHSKPGAVGGMEQAGAGDTSAGGGILGSMGGAGATVAGSGGNGGAGTVIPTQGGSGGSAGAGVCNQTMDNAACWSSRSVDALTQNQPVLYGAIFDGQRIVFPNGTTGYEDYHVQIDTQLDFVSTGKSFNSNPAIGNGYRGGTFDGRYVYLTPTQAESNGAAAQNYDTVAARYDSQGNFSSAESWSSFNLTQKSGTADLTVPGYRGAAFDGRYVYFAPNAVGDTASGNATRYDTQAPFNDKASWTDFDLTTVNAHAVAFNGAVLAGKYLYFLPSSQDSFATRYDTTAQFDDKASWSTFDVKTLDPAAYLFKGGVFDGRYLYLSSYQAHKGFIARYDTQASFEDASSWAIYNPIGAGFNDSISSGGAAYDGRYVYFVPAGSGSLVRYDPKLPFDSAEAWTKHRMTTQSTGAAFDGRYLYLVPQGFGSIQRFEARAKDDPGPTQASFY